MDTYSLFCFILVVALPSCPSWYQNSVIKWLKYFQKTHNLVNIQQQTYLQNPSTLAQPQQDLFFLYRYCVKHPGYLYKWHHVSENAFFTVSGSTLLCENVFIPVPVYPDF